MSPFNHNRYSRETQQFMPQYTYGSVSVTRDDDEEEWQERRRRGEIETEVDGDGFPLVSDRSSSTTTTEDARRQRKLVKMVLLTIVCTATLLVVGRWSSSSSLSSLLPMTSSTNSARASSARADVAPGTTKGDPFLSGSFNSWKQWGQGLSTYWSGKGAEWNKLKDDLVSKVRYVCFVCECVFCLLSSSFVVVGPSLTSYRMTAMFFFLFH
jgi:hypothetical protein